MGFNDTFAHDVQLGKKEFSVSSNVCVTLPAVNATFLFFSLFSCTHCFIFCLSHFNYCAPKHQGKFLAPEKALAHPSRDYAA